jgi:putative effector of murein hydrolase LrgA (UPF0299 family)
MKNSPYSQSKYMSGNRFASLKNSTHKKFLVGLVLLVALVAFEIFNFDTSRYALNSLLGNVEFLGLQWAAILAIAFCAIDFAGLVRIFTPERGRDEPKEVWYLTGAWLLGATMNAILTWWAVSLALLNHNFGNEVLSRQQLLLYVPIFVAVLVWLTRILFIGAFSVAGEHIFDIHSIGQTSYSGKQQPAVPTTTRPQYSQPAKSNSRPMPTAPQTRTARPAPKPQPTVPTSGFVEELQYEPITAKPAQPMPPAPQPAQPPSSRVRQRPPRHDVMRRPAINGVQARPRNRH